MKGVHKIFVSRGRFLVSNHFLYIHFDHLHHSVSLVLVHNHISQDALPPMSLIDMSVDVVKFIGAVVAISTLEGLQPCVDTQVPPSLLTVFKRLGAVDTMEGLRLMYPGYVSHKSPSVMEGLSTLVTQHLGLWVLVVLSYVHFQVGHSGKALSTLRTKQVWLPSKFFSYKY